MKKAAMLLIACLLAAPAAQAKIPLLNASCPGKIEVHADAGGPVYINGKEAKLKKYNDNSYNATHGHVNVTLTIMPDGTPDISYTGPDRANGVCKVAGGGGGGGKACPADVSQADRYKYPACK